MNIHFDIYAMSLISLYLPVDMHNSYFIFMYSIGSALEIWMRIKDFAITEPLSQHCNVIRALVIHRTELS